MKEIALKNSDKKAKVDDEDFEYLNQFNWFLDEQGHAVRFDYDTGDVIEMGYEVLKIND